MLNKIITLATLALLTSCSTLPEKRILLKPNPTSFIFTSNEQGVTQSILSELGVKEYRFMMLAHSWNRVGPIDATELKGQDKKNDFYLDPRSLEIGKSYMYPNLDYIALFRIHVEPIDSTHTRLIIYTIKPQVIVGKSLIPSFPHFSRDFNYHDVEPSTIEEYEILVRIGKALGEKMPEINYPNK